MRGWALLLLGEVVRPLPIASVATMKYLVGVQGLARTDEEVEAMVVPRQRCDHQDGVRPPGVERAVRHVGDGEILDDLAALQGEVAHLVELVGRIGGTMSGDWVRDRADQRQAGDREQDEMAHRRSLRVEGAGRKRTKLGRWPDLVIAASESPRLVARSGPCTRPPPDPWLPKRPSCVRTRWPSALHRRGVRGLCRVWARRAHFGTSPQFWLNLQARYELRLAERKAGKATRALPPFKRHGKAGGGLDADLR